MKNSETLKFYSKCRCRQQTTDNRSLEQLKTKTKTKKNIPITAKKRNKNTFITFGIHNNK